MNENMAKNDYERPILTVDVVVLTLIKEELHMLMVRRNREPFLGTYTLPGGFVHAQEDVDSEETARRVLRDKASVEVRHIEQLYTFANSTRDKRGWSASISYLAIVNADEVSLSEDAKFVPVSESVGLPFDHSLIAGMALSRIRDKASYSSLPGFLLSENFTLPSLQKVYEQVLGVKLNAAAFRRKVVDQELVEEVSEAGEYAGRGRPAKLYKLKERSLQDFGRVVMLPDSRRGG